MQLLGGRNSGFRSQAPRYTLVRCFEPIHSYAGHERFSLYRRHVPDFPITYLYAMKPIQFCKSTQRAIRCAAGTGCGSMELFQFFRPYLGGRHLALPKTAPICPSI